MTKKRLDTSLMWHATPYEFFKHFCYKLKEQGSIYMFAIEWTQILIWN